MARVSRWDGLLLRVACGTRHDPVSPSADPPQAHAPSGDCPLGSDTCPAQPPASRRGPTGRCQLSHPQPAWPSEASCSPATDSSPGTTDRRRHRGPGTEASTLSWGPRLPNPAGLGQGEPRKHLKPQETSHRQVEAQGVRLDRLSFPWWGSESSCHGRAKACLYPNLSLQTGVSGQSWNPAQLTWPFWPPDLICQMGSPPQWHGGPARV